MAEAMRSCLEMLRRASLEHGSVRGFCLSKSLQVRYLVITPRAGDLPPTPTPTLTPTLTLPLTLAPTPNV